MERTLGTRHHRRAPRRPRRLEGMAAAALILAGVLSGAGASVLAQEPAAPDDPALRGYLAANGLLGRGMYELAAAEYRTFLNDNAAHPKAAAARYGLGVSLFRLGQFAEAEAELTRVEGVEGFEFAPEAAVVVGQCRMAREQWGEAAESLARVVERFPNHDLADDAAAMRAEALYRAGRHSEAEQAAAAVAKRWPVSPVRARADLVGGLALMAQDGFVPAAACFEAVLKREKTGDLAERAALLAAQCNQRIGTTAALDAAAAGYRAIAERPDGPFGAEALLGLSQVLTAKGDSAKAGEVLDRLAKQFPQSPLLKETSLQRARVWFDQGDFARARRAFEEAGRTGAPPDEAAYWTAKCDLRAGEFARAADQLAAAQRTYPESGLLAEIMYDRGVALVRAGEDAAAFEVLRDFRAQFREHDLRASATHLAATAAHRQGRYGESLALCREFLTANPKHESAPAIAFIAAENLLLDDKTDQAIEAYRAFLTDYPSDPFASRAAFRLGSALHQLGKSDEARPLLERIASGRDTPAECRPALLLLGDIAFQRGDWAEAARLCADYLALGDALPGADDALLKLGLAHQRQDQPAEAITAFDRLLKAFPDSPHRLQARFERGQSLVALGRKEEATVAFEAVIKQDPDSRFAPYAQNHLAVIALGRGDSAQAAARFEAAAAAAPPDSDLAALASFQRAQSLSATGDHAAAAAFDQFVRDHPRHALASEASVRAAIAAARAGDAKAALPVLIDAETQHDASVDPALRNALAYEIAWTLRETGRTEEAAKRYQQLVDRVSPNPTNAGPPDPIRLHAMIDLAQLRADAGQLQPAVELLERVRNDARSAVEVGGSGGKDGARATTDLAQRATYQLAVCQFRLDQHEQSARTMAQYLSGDVDAALAPSAHLVCAESLVKLGRHAEAEPHLRTIADGPASDPAHSTAILRLGECLAAMQRWPDAERAFADFLDRYPSHDLWFQARFGLGWSRENQGRHDNAIAAYRAVVERHTGPTAARAQFQIGECLFAQKKHDEAARELLKVDILYAYPEWSAAALYEAGRCFEALNDPAKARIQYERIGSAFGTTNWAKLARDRLSATATQPTPGR